MHLDLRLLSAGTAIGTDICIVGAGPAGLTIAREFVNSGQRVLVLEAGGAETIDSIEALQLEASNTELEPASLSRWRQVSGTAALWNARLRNRQSGRLIRMSAPDFDRREWLPHSGWPLTLEALAPFYERAERLTLEPKATSIDTGKSPRHFTLNSGSLTTTLEAFGPADLFMRQIPRLLINSTDVTVMTNANVVEIVAEPGVRHPKMLYVSSNNKRFSVAFRILILAAGAIENARLLLVSRGSGRDGLANSNGLVGRFFMDHPRVKIGELFPLNPMLFDNASAYDIRSWNGRFLGGKLTPSDAFLHNNETLNFSAQLLPRPSVDLTAAIDALRSVIPGARQARLSTLRDVYRISRHSRLLLSTAFGLALHQCRLVPLISDGGWSRLRNNSRRFESFEVILQCEQAPDPENRIVLGERTDEFGVPRARVESRWTAIDLRSIAKAAETIADELESAGIGRLRLTENPDDRPLLYQVGGAHHHMGTTRMDDDPSLGVVDSYGRLHETENIFVAGGSVFPTAGYANPTLTIVALALRLADHLKSEVIP